MIYWMFLCPWWKPLIQLLLSEPKKHLMLLRPICSIWAWGCFVYLCLLRPWDSLGVCLCFWLIYCEKIIQPPPKINENLDKNMHQKNNNFKFPSSNFCFVHSVLQRFPDFHPGSKTKSFTFKDALITSFYVLISYVFIHVVVQVNKKSSLYNLSM